MPFLTATKPLIFSAFLAFWTAIIQVFFLLSADFFLLTILPVLFFVKEDAVIPPTVFSLDPRNTKTFAIRPFAILLTAFFFIAFMAFMAAMAFIAFIALAILLTTFFFMAFMAFMAAMAFIAFIALAIAVEVSLRSWCSEVCNLY